MTRKSKESVTNRQKLFLIIQIHKEQGMRRITLFTESFGESFMHILIYNGFQSRFHPPFFRTYN